MKKFFSPRAALLTLAAASLVTVASAWQTRPRSSQRQTFTDTVPNRNKEIKDIDQALSELDRATEKLDIEIKEIDLQKIKVQIDAAMKQIDVAKIQAEALNAIKDIDASKIQLEVEKAMRSLEKIDIKASVEEALSKIDAEKMQADISKAVKSIDAEKIKAATDAAVAKIDMQKMQQELNEIREIEMPRIEETLKDLKPQIDLSLKEAKEGVAKAKAELLAYKKFLTTLESNGLIDQKSNYEIRYNNGELFINGKKQPAETTNKYENFLKSHKEFTLKKNADGFNLND